MTETAEATRPTHYCIRHKGQYWGYELFGWMDGGWSLMFSAEDDELPFIWEYLKSWGVSPEAVPVVKRLRHKSPRLAEERG